jgi:hypothetical protein
MNTTNQTNDPTHIPLTPAELQELEQLHSNATAFLPLDTYEDYEAGINIIDRHTRVKWQNVSAYDDKSQKLEQGEYIVAACNALPRLLREIERLKAERDKVVGDLHAQLATVTKERDEARAEIDEAVYVLSENTQKTAQDTNGNTLAELSGSIMAEVFTLRYELQEARRVDTKDTP